MKIRPRSFAAAMCCAAASLRALDTEGFNRRVTQLSIGQQPLLATLPIQPKHIMTGDIP